jgi:PKD repeat protein
MMIRYLLIVLLLATEILASDHCLLYPVSLTDRVQTSDLIIEAEIVRDSAFAEQNMIYTAYQLRVLGTLKGAKYKTIQMLTEGGILQNRALIVRPSLTPTIGSRGIFFLKNSGANYVPFAGPQSMIALQEDGKVHEPFHVYPSMLDAIERIVALTGIPYRHSPIINPREKSEKTFAAFIGSISPTTSTAGRGSILTITGSGFGASRTGNAKVEFKNGNDGGSTWTSPASSQYVSWSDAEIQVRIPSLAGTGQIRVTAADNSTAISGQTLMIDYSLINTSLNRIWLTNQNGIGGHTWTFNNAFGNDPTIAFKRALQNWRCNTFVNFSVSANTTSINQYAKDGINVISFNASLPAGTLGVTYNWYAACAANQYYNDEFDMIFAPSPGAGWNYGPGPTYGGSFDFETVALHELGHAVQLGHVINTAIVMHYALGPNTDKRTLNGISDIAGGNDVVTFSTATKPCGPDEMIALNSNNCTLFAPPIASFIAAPILGCAPLEVQFTDQSQNNPTTFAWDIDNNGTTDYTTASPQHVYTQPGTYTVKLTVSSGSGMNSVTMTNMITVFQNPSANGRGAYTTCQGSQAVLGPVGAPSGGLPPYTYSWAPSTGLSNAFTLNPTLPIDFTNQRIYALTITDQRGCNIIVRDTVNPNPALIVSAGADRTECAGAVVTLGGTPTVVGGTMPYTYAWSPTTGLNSSVIANPTIALTQNQTFIVTVTDAKGCTKQDTVIVNVHPDLKADAGKDKLICVNSRDTIGGKPTAQGGVPPYQYQWFPATGLSSATIANPIVISPQTRNYILQVTDGFGCVKRDTVQISALLTDKPILRIVIGKQVLCENDSIVLEALGSFTSYRWKDGSVRKTITIRKSDTVFVECKNANGCTMISDTMIIRMIDAPKMKIAGLGEYCVNDIITLYADPAPNFSQTWSVFGGDIIGINSADSVKIRMQKSGIIQLERKQGNCTFFQRDSVRVFPRFDGKITIEGRKESCEGDTVILSIEGTMREYTWPDGTKGKKTLNRSGIFWADIEDIRGCFSRSDTVTIQFNAPPVKPTITVNGDSLIASSATAYQWYSEKGEIPNAHLQWFMPDSTGIYRVRVWNVEDCSSISDPFSFIRVTALPKEESQTSIILGHPIDKELRILHPYQNPQISIFNMLGIQVYQERADSYQHSISVEHLPQGYYSLIIDAEVLPLLILR